MKKIGLRRSVILSAIAMLTVLVLTVHPVQATVYSAHAEHWKWPIHWDVYLTADTTADTLWFKWTENCPLGFWYWGSYIHVWDDLGNKIYWIDCPLGTHIVGSGEKTFSYARTDVIVHAEVRWCHSLGFKNLHFFVTVRCDLTIPANMYCPTLFTWNGNDYVDYGVIDIHNPSGEDVVREVPIQAEDVDIINNKVKFRLREGWEGLEFSESVIDQVKLYSIDDEGKRYLCPLISAEHNTLGKVLPQLLASDDNRVQILLLETIDLTFIVPYQNVQGFTFVIEGCNITKR